MRTNTPRKITDKPDIVKVVEREGVALKHNGGKFWGLCPFHSEKTPSFCIYADKQRFFCFGCGEGGDVIDFIRKLKQISFKDAIEYLGVNGNERRPPNRDELWKALERELFLKWQKSMQFELAETYRLYNRIISNIQTMDDVELCASLFHELSIIEHQMNLLAHGNEDDKRDLFDRYKAEQSAYQ